MDPRFVPPDGVDIDISTTDEMKDKPRVDVTMSMLYAYANMRGKPATEFDPDSADPLHSALYPIRSRTCLQTEVDLPLRANVGLPSVHDPPLGTKYFWDPIQAKRVMAHKLKPLMELRKTMKRDSGYRSASTWTLKTLASCSDSSDHPPTLAPNHYKGEDVWSNFGYVKINGHWVDPESERELSAAYKGETDAKYYAGTLSVINRPRSGPRIMNPNELRSLYDWYAEEVSLGADADTEGDPRDLRINAETFAFWAQGAKMGEHYERHVMEPQKPIPRAQYDMEGTLPPKIMPRLQFDGESIMTGEYDVDENPLMLHSSLGANMTRPPVMLSHMDPQTCLDLERAHFLGPRDKSPSTSTASTAELYTTEAAGGYLIPEDPMAGIREAAGRANRFEWKERFRNFTIEEHLCRRDVIVKQRKLLNQEVDQIDKRIEETKKELEKKRALLSRATSNQNGSSPSRTPTFVREETSSSTSSERRTPTQIHDIEFQTLGHAPRQSPRPIRSPKKSTRQYKRFFKELAEREQIMDRETWVAHETLVAEYNDIAEELHLLRHCRDEKQVALDAVRDAFEAAAREEGDREHHFGELFAGPHEDAREIGGEVVVES